VSSHLSLDLRRLGDASIVRARGDIDLSTLAAASAALDTAREGSAALFLDLRDVDFMDTSGLRLVIEEQLRAATSGYRFAVVPGPRKVQRLFEIAGFAADDELFMEAPTPRIGGGDPA
jgi:anti-anti-sigma factor